jgi:hypothetical protein
MDTGDFISGVIMAFAIGNVVGVLLTLLADAVTFLNPPKD